MDTTTKKNARGMRFRLLKKYINIYCDICNKMFEYKYRYCVRARGYENRNGNHDRLRNTDVNGIASGVVHVHVLYALCI